MELRHLRYFVAVAEEQNVTRAAARLHISQPPLSRQIRDLEEELGISLFEHGAKTVRLTDAGRVFLQEVCAALRRVDDAVQMAKAVATGECGEIHVGFAPSLMVKILPMALRHFHESSPGVRVQLHDCSTEAMVRGLREGKLDAALTIQVAPKVRDGLVFEELCRYGICLATHPAHPLARARKIGLDQIAAERLIAYTLADYPEYRAWLSDLFLRAGYSPQIAEEHDSSTSLIASVEAGRGVALVQEGFECLAGPRLKVRLLSPGLPPFVAGIAYRKENNSIATQNFIAAARRVTTNDGPLIERASVNGKNRVGA